QVVLAWMLKPEDFGVAGLAIMAATLIGLLREGGIAHVLLRRQRHFDRWANAAFWMSMLTGLAPGLLLLAAAPALQIVYKRPGIGRVVLMLAGTSAIVCLRLVPAARVQARMQFRFLSIARTALALLSSGVSIALALMGMGAASLVIPMTTVAAFSAVLFWGP